MVLLLKTLTIYFKLLIMYFFYSTNLPANKHAYD